MLMQRRERIRAKESGETIRKLQDSDYLLGVYDGNRMGALRFKTDINGNFMDDDAYLATPPVTSLRALEQASLNYEHSDAEQSPEYTNWVRMLYSPGSSLEVEPVQKQMLLILMGIFGLPNSQVRTILQM
jgi:serine/threonine-protein kinase HipA